jgi:hypothetical protein
MRRKIRGRGYEGNEGGGEEENKFNICYVQ